jgi:hypothetical protein
MHLIAKGLFGCVFKEFKSAFNTQKVHLKEKKKKTRLITKKIKMKSLVRV